MLGNCGEFVRPLAGDGCVWEKNGPREEDSPVTQRISLGQAVAALVLLASLGLLGSWALGGVSTYADAFSHLFGHALGGAIGGALALVWRRRAWLVLVVVGLATVAAPALVAWRATVDTTIRPGPGELKIVSFNTWHANLDLDRLQAFIEHEDADVVLLIEFGPTKRALIDRVKGRYPYAVGCAESWDCSIEILSKHPFASTAEGRRELNDGPPRVIATYGSGPAPLTLIAAHMMRPIDGPNGHLLEMRRVAGLVRQAKGPVIVAGDFNATWWSHSFKVFREESGLTHMGRYLPRWPSQARWFLPQLNIDHLWVSPGMSVTDVHVGPDTGSDHRPLVAIVKLPEGFVW